MNRAKRLSSRKILIIAFLTLFIGTANFQAFAAFEGKAPLKLKDLEKVSLSPEIASILGRSVLHFETSDGTFLGSLAVEDGDSWYSDGTFDFNKEAPLAIIYYGPDEVKAGTILEIAYDGNQISEISLPRLLHTTTLYIGIDGSTYYDADLTQLAQKASSTTEKDPFKWYVIEASEPGANGKGKHIGLNGHITFGFQNVTGKVPITFKITDAGTVLEPFSVEISGAEATLLKATAEYRIYSIPQVSEAVTVTVTDLGSHPELPKDQQGADIKFSAHAVWITVEEIQFNHILASGDTDALDIRKNKDDKIKLAEWVKRWRRNNPATYIKNKNITIKAKFKVKVASIHSVANPISNVKIWAISEGVLKNLGEKTVTSWQRKTQTTWWSDFISFTPEKRTPTKVSKNEITWQWKMKNVNGSTSSEIDINKSGPHTIYTVLAMPQAPWYTGDETTWPWADVLKYSCEWASGKETEEDVAAKITERIYGCKLKYDSDKGEWHYAKNWVFYLTRFINEAIKGTEEKLANCVDCAVAVTTFANIVGSNMKVYTSRPFGYLNVIDPIGNNADYTNNPFYAATEENYRDDKIVYQDGTDASCLRSAFGMHAFSGYGAAPNIYDATMKVDTDSNPDTTILYPSPNGDARSTKLTSKVLIDRSAHWDPNQFRGLKLNPNANNVTPDPYKVYTIRANSPKAIIIEEGTDMRTDAKSGEYYEIFDPENPQINPEWLIGVPWDNYKTKVIDSGIPGIPTSKDFTIETKPE